MGFWDWKSGHQFQRLDSLVQPGSLDSEAGIFCAEFDKTGLRLITGEADKTIKIWKEDDVAVSVVVLYRFVHRMYYIIAAATQGVLLDMFAIAAF